MRLLPRLTCCTRPDSRRIRKWWLSVDLDTGKPKDRQVRSVPSGSVRKVWITSYRRGSESAFRTVSRSISLRVG
ncbi:hypothetical protein GCM10017562_27660 [Streptomyces roseofulvus]